MRTGVPILGERDILLARLALREACTALRFGSAETARIVTAASELTRNICRYADRGVMRVRSLDSGGRQGIEIEFEDQGPGIADLELAMTEGYSTSGGYGMGLPGARRLMDSLEIQSALGVGTTITMTKWRQPEPAGARAMKLDPAAQELIAQLQAELAQTNQDILLLTLDMDDRVEARTQEIMQLNRTLEQRVAERTFQLQQANQELEIFAYSVSHDLRAPLRHVDGFLDLLAEQLGTSLEGEAAHYFVRIKAATQHMGLLISALLHFSSLGRQALVLGPLDLNALVAGVVEGLQDEVRERQVIWTLDPLPAIHGDASLIWAVFENLIGNAVKFTAHRPQARIYVGCAQGADGEAIVFVRDNGAGFNPAYAHKLFGVFQRLHRQDEFEGTGIGLASVQRIVQRHGGRVWAEGRADLGATFFVAFPAAHGAAASPSI